MENSLLDPLKSTFMSCLKALGERLLNFSGNFGLDAEQQKFYRDSLHIDNQNLEEKFKLAFFQLPQVEKEVQRQFLNKHYGQTSFLAVSFDLLVTELNEFFKLGSDTSYTESFLKNYVQNDIELASCLEDILAEFYVAVLLLYPHEDSGEKQRAQVSKHLEYVKGTYQIEPENIGIKILMLAQRRLSLEPSQISKLYGILDFLAASVPCHDKIYDKLLSLGSAYVRENAIVIRVLRQENFKFKLSPHWLFEYASCPIQAYPYVLEQLSITQETKIFLNAQKYKLDKNENFIPTGKFLALTESLAYVNTVLEKQKLEKLVPLIPLDPLSKKTIDKI